MTAFKAARFSAYLATSLLRLFSLAIIELLAIFYALFSSNLSLVFVFACP
jgi:hypothetical protein